MPDITDIWLAEIPDIKMGRNCYLLDHISVSSYPIYNLIVSTYIRIPTDVSIIKFKITGEDGWTRDEVWNMNRPPVGSIGCWLDGQYCVILRPGSGIKILLNIGLTVVINCYDTRVTEDIISTLRS